ncbi:MAG: membrane protein insertion efficiency factor YidD [Pseudomonadota bacterium]
MSESSYKPIAGLLLRIYKMTLSPVFMAFGTRCRHEPTCSEYGATCVSRHGVWAGGWMTLARLLRCRPGGTFGVDPAPGRKPKAPFYAPWRYGDWDGPDMRVSDDTA